MSRIDFKRFNSIILFISFYKRFQFNNLRSYKKTTMKICDVTQKNRYTKFTVYNLYQDELESNRFLF